MGELETETGALRQLLAPAGCLQLQLRVTQGGRGRTGSEPATPSDACFTAETSDRRQHQLAIICVVGKGMFNRHRYTIYSLFQVFYDLKYKFQRKKRGN